MSAFTPLVTVVVPSFNEDPHIVRASLESIRAQTFADFECIVVDESSRPELAEACRAVCAEDPRFIYVHPTERLGLPKSLNLAISKARGQLIEITHQLDPKKFGIADQLREASVLLLLRPLLIDLLCASGMREDDARAELPEV